ncbi:MAG: DUF1801 domain-containing protein [Bacteroidetes bacterium]|nr:DUF1801 domain-containing protein [Bacteroidota bacterium]
MKSDTQVPVTIDEYIAQYPPAMQELLAQVRKTIREAAPGATECISYQMPTFRLEGNLVHFAACKQHIGFYPSPSGIRAFAEALAPYVTSKGAAQFLLDKPMPYALIADIVRFRVQENLEKAAARKAARAAGAKTKKAS